MVVLDALPYTTTITGSDDDDDLSSVSVAHQHPVH
jgi:hypothetical protein